MQDNTKKAKSQTSQLTENQILSGSQTKPLQLAVENIKKQYGNANNFLSVFNKNIQPVVATNIERAYLGTAPSLYLAQQAYNQQLIIAWLMAQLENLNDFIGVNQKMTFMQMEETAQIILCNFHFLKVTEIHLFLHRLKSGQYGEFYGSIDPIRITNSLRIFLKERNNEISTFEQLRRNQEAVKQRNEWQLRAITRDEYEKIKLQKSINYK